jgi:16S rRNA (uracil1498-N3)-methyltransferase
MRLHRFFVNHNLDDKKEVVVKDSELYNQLKNVFRFTVGGQVILLDGSGYEYHSVISSFGFGETSFSIISKRQSKSVPDRELHLICSLIKKNKFEWILEKGTELGVSRFIPVLTQRSEKKSLNMERMQKILKEATEQSERATIPILENVSDLENVLSREIPLLAFDPKGESFVAKHAANYSPLGILIGPEGGWTERELFLFKKNKIPIYSLGKAVLKAETAALAVASLILI